MMEKKYILDALAVEMKIRRMAYEIMENNPGEQQLVIAGIKNKGMVLAGQLASVLHEIAPGVQLTLVSIGLDKSKPADVVVSGNTEFTGSVIILVDDVTNSGKTLLYALKPFLTFYPRKIQTVVLVERSHKIYPVHPDYVGISLATTLQEQIVVETSGNLVTGAYLC